MWVVPLAPSLPVRWWVVGWGVLGPGLTYESADAASTALWEVLRYEFSLKDFDFHIFGNRPELGRALDYCVAATPKWFGVSTVSAAESPERAP